MKQFTRFLLFLLTAILPSCAKPPTNGIHPVRGSLLVNGKPAVGAVVTFHRAGDPNKAMLPYATVQADGSFDLSTMGGKDGAAPGCYRITVIWKKKSKKSDDDDESLLDKKYLAPETSGLEVEISDQTSVIPPLQLNGAP